MPAREDLDALLAGAEGGDPASLLVLSRSVSERLRRYGAYDVCDDWARVTRESVEIVLDRLDAVPGRGARATLDSVIRNRLWVRALRVLDEDELGAGLLRPTLRRLVAHFDRGRRLEGHWEAVVRETESEAWTRWRSERVGEPWALLCTIVRRALVERFHAAFPGTELDRSFQTPPDEQTLSAHPDDLSTHPDDPALLQLHRDPAGLDAEQAHELRGHLERCRTCRDAYAAFGSLAARHPRAPDEAEAPPEAPLWEESLRSGLGLAILAIALATMFWFAA